MAQQSHAVCLRLQSVTSSLLAIPGCLLAVCRGPGSALSRRSAVLGGTLSIFRRPQHFVQPPVSGPGGVARRELAIVCLGGVIARRRREVAGVGNGITGGGCIGTRPGRFSASRRALLAKVARLVMHGGIGALGKISIAGRLIFVRRGLVVVGCGLVDVSARLVSVRERLILIGKRLILISTRLISRARARGRGFPSVVRVG